MYVDKHLVYVIEMQVINITLYYKHTERISIWNKFKVTYVYIG